MLAFFVGLTAISIILLIVGFTWMMISNGQTRRRSGEEVGAEIMGQSLAEEMEADGEATVYEKTAFKGKGVMVEREAGIDFADPKAAVRAGDWRTAAPALLGAIGLFGLILFGALALFVAISDKLVGAIILAVVLFTLARIVVNIARA